MSEWRVIITDSEQPTGVAPVCPQTTALHTLRIDNELVPTIDHSNVYDCCPHPHIETFTTHNARELAELLTASGAELCS